MTIFNYTLNYVDLALAVLFILFAVNGYRKGILMTVVNFIRYSVGFFLCFYCSDNLAKPVYDSVVAPAALNTINQKITTSTNLDEVLGNLDKFINSLPSFAVKIFDVSSLNVPNTDDVSHVILDDVFAPILLALTKGAIFVAVFIVFFLATGLIISLVKRSRRKKSGKGKKASPLKKADKIFGGIFGLLKSFVIMLAITSVLMYILNMFGDSAGTNTFLTQLKDSSLLRLLNEINPFNALTEGII